MVAWTDGTAVLWNVQGARPLSLLGGHDTPVNDVCFSMDGSLLATCGDGDGGQVRVWKVRDNGGVSLQTCQLLFTGSPHRSEALSVCFGVSNKGQMELLSVGRDNIGVLHSLSSSGQVAGRLTRHSAGVTSCAWRGNLMLTGSIDQTGLSPQPQAPPLPLHHDCHRHPH